MTALATSISVAAPRRLAMTESPAVVVSAADLLLALRAVAKVAPRRATTPILRCVRLTTFSGALRVQANDLDVQIALTVPCDRRADLDVCVDARILLDLVKMSPRSELRFALDGDRLAVRAGATGAHLETLPASEHPELEFDAADTTPILLPLRTDHLVRALHRVNHAISTEETRYYLCGVYLHVRDATDPCVTFAATDGGRLSAYTISADPDAARRLAECKAGVIVPHLTANLILALLKGKRAPSETALTFRRAANGLVDRIAIDAGNLRIVSKTVDGTYPDYQRVIPTAPRPLYSVDRKALLDGLLQVGAALGRDRKAIALSAAETGLALAIRVKTSENEVEATVSADIVDSLPEHGLNQRYLVELLKTRDEGAIHFASENPSNHPIVIRDGDKAGVYVIMPMRI